MEIGTCSKIPIIPEARDNIIIVKDVKVLILKATVTQKTRRPSKPSRNAKKKRMDVKSQRGKTKAMRQKPSGD